jgi:4-hydroxybenzoate polyprenyltransferase
VGGVLVRASHPAPTVAVTTLATVVGVSAGRDLTSAVTMAAAVLTGQLTVGWTNDLVDAARDRAVGRTDKPMAAPGAPVHAVRLAVALAAIACVPLSLASGAAAGGCHLLGVLSGWAYNFGLKRTPVSWLPYASGFGLLIAFAVRGAPSGSWPPVWMTLAAALLGVGAHFANAAPDLEDDRRTGVRGLPQRIGRRGSAALAAVTLLGSSAALVLGPTGAPSAGRLALGITAGTFAVACAGAAAVTARRWPFLLVYAVAACDVALLTVAARTGH